MTNNTELLRCPFCGGKAKVSSFPGAHNVWCENQPVSCGNRAMFTVEQWNTRAAPAEDVRAVVDGPVYGPYMVRWIGPGVWAGIPDELPAELEGSNVWLYRRPQRQVVLPERRKVDINAELYDMDSVTEWHKDCEWNACLDELKRLNP